MCLLHFSKKNYYEKNLLNLWEFHKIYFDDIHPNSFLLDPPRSTLANTLTYTLHFVSSFFLYPIKSSLCNLCTPECEAVHWIN